MPYTYSQPSVKPDWATDDVGNGLGDANNVQEPPLGKKQEGYDYGEKPPREFQNWLHRITNIWIYYFDERITDILIRIGVLETKTSNARSYFKNQI